MLWTLTASASGDKTCGLNLSPRESLVIILMKFFKFQRLADHVARMGYIGVPKKESIEWKISWKKTTTEMERQLQDVSSWLLQVRGWRRLAGYRDI